MRAKDIFIKDEQTRVILDVSVVKMVEQFAGLAWSEFEEELGGSIFRLIKVLNNKTPKEVLGDDPDNGDSS
jgi:hypothetical protein